LNLPETSTRTAFTLRANPSSVKHGCWRWAVLDGKGPLLWLKGGMLWLRELRVLQFIEDSFFNTGFVAKI
jgi:hypothetical protein